jgi:hypothetical protein
VGPESYTGELCHYENALENKSEHIIKIQYIYIYTPKKVTFLSIIHFEMIWVSNIKEIFSFHILKVVNVCFDYLIIVK